MVARQDGSMLPLFVVFLAIVLWLAAAASNVASIALQRQRLQALADQKVLAMFVEGSYRVGQTAETSLCEQYELPMKLIGLPTSHEICVKSAAR